MERFLPALPTAGRHRQSLEGSPEAPQEAMPAVSAVHLTNPTNTLQTATYTVTPSSGSCSGGTFTVTVNVNPTPSINNIPTVVCEGGAFNVTPANGTNGIVPAGTTYSWPAPVVTGGLTGGAPGTNAAFISGTLTNPTNLIQTATYTVTPTSGGCTGNSFTVTVSVNPVPEINNITRIICSGSAFDATPVDGTNGAVPPGTLYSWPAPTVTGGITGAIAGNRSDNRRWQHLLTRQILHRQQHILITPLLGSCTGNTFTVTVTVNPRPSISNKTASTCGGVPFTVTPVNGARYSTCRDYLQLARSCTSSRSFRRGCRKQCFQYQRNTRKYNQ